LTLCIIEPRDTLLFRDAREFGASESSRARTLDFPFPSVTTGALRTRLGSDGNGRFDPGKIDALLRMQFRGPFLIELGKEDEVIDWLFPSPSDTVVFKSDNEEELRLWSLFPRKLQDGESTDLDSRVLLGIPERRPGKADAEAPQFWSWKRAWSGWLHGEFRDAKKMRNEWGIPGLVREERTHLSVDPQTGAADEGRIFSTQMLRFSWSPGPLSRARRFALAVALPEGKHTIPALAPIGGERRLAAWRQSPLGLPSCPDDLLRSIVKNRACRLALLTPACFEKGAVPTCLLENGIEVVTFACKGYQTIAGWDLKLRQAKPSRRLAPAGSVYFLKLPRAWSETVIREWVKSVWFHCVSDSAQDRLDGFGASVLGSWDGSVQGEASKS
jgi:CRISPR-associated protein Cmr3